MNNEWMNEWMNEWTNSLNERIKKLKSCTIKITKCNHKKDTSCWVIY